MEEKQNFIDPLLDRAEAYGKTTFELLKLKLLDKSTDVISTLISRVILVIVLLLFVITLNIALGFWLGELLGKTYYGFLAVAGFYGLLGIILLMLHKNVKTRLSNSIITQFLN